MKQKKGILIDATGGSEWIGGLYYKKNILYSLLQNEYLFANFKFIVLTEEENRNIFGPFAKKIKIVISKQKNKYFKMAEILCISKMNSCGYIFPCGNDIYAKFGITSIHWIADFQHNRLPQLFSEIEKEARTQTYFKYARDGMPLVLSSNDARNDFGEFYNKSKNNVYIVHFVSYIEDTIRNLTPSMEQAVLERKGLKGKKYICIMNQFWQHKNHIAVLEAMKAYFSNNPKSDLLFAFTGKLDDYRAPEYIEKLKRLFEQEIIKKHSLLLGFIDRVDQIVIMKNAQFIVQPSLFEGWGTVVEDAKVLDKTILLSDIPVHREQKSNKCQLFDPHNPQELAKLIEEETVKEHMDDIEFGIEDMHRRAKEYSKSFEQLLKDRERNRV